MNRICPLPFDLERNKYYRIKACFEPVNASDVGTVFSRRFEVLRMMFEDVPIFMDSVERESAEYIHVYSKCNGSYKLRFNI